MAFFMFVIFVPFKVKVLMLTMKTTIYESSSDRSWH